MRVTPRVKRKHRQRDRGPGVRKVSGLQNALLSAGQARRPSIPGGFNVTIGEVVGGWSCLENVCVRQRYRNTYSPWVFADDLLRALANKRRISFGFVSYLRSLNV